MRHNTVSCDYIGNCSGGKYFNQSNWSMSDKKIAANGIGIFVFVMNSLFYEYDFCAQFITITD